MRYAGRCRRTRPNSPTSHGRPSPGQAARRRRDNTAAIGLDEIAHKVVLELVATRADHRTVVSLSPEKSCPQAVALGRPTPSPRIASRCRASGASRCANTGGRRPGAFKRDKAPSPARRAHRAESSSESVESFVIIGESRARWAGHQSGHKTLRERAERPGRGDTLRTPHGCRPALMRLNDTDKTGTG